MNIEKLSQVVTFLPKSKIKAGEAKDNGKYVFFTSSDTKRSYIDKFLYDDELVVLGTGGFASCNYYNGKFAVSTDNFVIKPKNNLLPKYLYYYLRKNNLSVLNNGFRGIGIKHISKDYVMNISIPMTTLDNQKSIINNLDNINETIEREKQCIIHYDELIKSRFNEMFGDINDKNNGYTINDICVSIVRGPFGSSLKKEYLVKKAIGTYKVYEQKHAIRKNAFVGDYYINQTKFNELKRFRVQSGDFIMSCSGTIGELFKLPPDCENGIINQALLKFAVNHTLVNDCYFLYAMKIIIESIDRYGAAIQNITSVSVIKKTNIYVPTIEEQNKFSAFVKLIDKLKFNCQQRIKLYQELLDKKMDEYFG